MSEHPDYDIFLCSAKKDYNKIKYTVQAIKDNVTGYKNIFLCTPTKLNLNINGVIQCLDREVLDINPFQFKYRPNWIYQQMLKLFQNITPNDYYATIDTDILINRKMCYFNSEGKPVWYMGWEQNNRPYFEFQEKMFGYGRVHNHTFIADMNFFNKKIIKEMLDRFGYDFNSYIKKSIEVINDKCYPAENEVYGSYIHKFHPGMYEYKELKFDVGGRVQKDPHQFIYSEEEIEKIIKESKSNNFDIITMHSWCWDTANLWGF